MSNIKLFSTVNGLNKEIMRRANVALNNEVREIVEQKLKKHIEKDVYSVYEPKVYERRKEDGGLLDSANIRSIVYERTLHVYSEAPPDDSWGIDEDYIAWLDHKDHLARMIERGVFNIWNRRSYRWTKPRPFVTNTQEDINKHPKQILNALKRRIERDS